MEKGNIRQDVLDRIKKIPIVETLGFEFIELDNGICRAKVKHDKKYAVIFFIMLDFGSADPVIQLNKFKTESFNYRDFLYSVKNILPDISFFHNYYDEFVWGLFYY